MFYRRKAIRKTLCDMEISEGGVVTCLRGNEATQRELQDLGIVVDARISRVWEKPVDGGLPVCLQVGDRRVTLDGLLAGSVEVTVPRVCTDAVPDVQIDEWRVRYLLKAL